MIVVVRTMEDVKWIKRFLVFSVLVLVCNQALFLVYNHQQSQPSQRRRQQPHRHAREHDAVVNITKPHVHFIHTLNSTTNEFIPVDSDLPSQKNPHRRTIFTTCTADQFVLIREFLGNIHFWEAHRQIFVFSSGFNEDQFAELSFFVNVRVFPVENNNTLVNLTRHYFSGTAGFVFIPVHMFLQKRLCQLDSPAAPAFIDDTAIVAPDCEQWGSLQISCAPLPNGYVAEQRLPNTPPGECNTRVHMPPAVLSTENKLPPRTFCMCIATYNSHLSPEAVTSIPLLTQFLPAFINTTVESRKNLSFALYLATQVDAVWDNADARARIMRILETPKIPVRVFRYALNPGLRDIAWKYNLLINQAFQDGCEYFYQFSDDAVFNTPNWADAIVRQLDSTNGFGTAGVLDTRNHGTMTLGASGRVHIELQGTFWPIRLKNWYADDYIHHVYTSKYSVRIETLSYTNSQQLGQRYQHCIHQRVYQESMTEARLRAIPWLLKHNDTEGVEIMQRAANEPIHAALELNQQPDVECPGEEEQEPVHSQMDM